MGKGLRDLHQCSRKRSYYKGEKSGLISLARHLLTLAQDSVPKHSHIHLDEYNSLEEGSAELINQKDTER